MQVPGHPPFLDLARIAATHLQPIQLPLIKGASRNAWPPSG